MKYEGVTKYHLIHIVYTMLPTLLKPPQILHLPGILLEKHILCSFCEASFGGFLGANFCLGPHVALVLLAMYWKASKDEHFQAMFLVKFVKLQTAHFNMLLLCSTFAAWKILTFPYIHQPLKMDSCF
jgi:hypothetical protein